MNSEQKKMGIRLVGKSGVFLWCVCLGGVYLWDWGSGLGLKMGLDSFLVCLDLGLRMIEVVGV